MDFDFSDQFFRFLPFSAKPPRQTVRLFSDARKVFSAVFFNDRRILTLTSQPFLGPRQALHESQIRALSLNRRLANKAPQIADKGHLTYCQAVTRQPFSARKPAPLRRMTKNNRSAKK